MGMDPESAAFCICCDREVKFLCPELNCKTTSIGCPDDATVWRSWGNYGSTVYDPQNSNEFLELVLCDNCLKQKASKVRRKVHEQKETRLISVEPFVERKLRGSGEGGPGERI